MVDDPSELVAHRLRRSETKDARLVAAAKTPVEQEADDRSLIARWIVGTFLCSIIAIFVLLVARAMAPGRWDEAVGAALELFKIGILPVVTLVLGFYFGRSERR